MFNPPDEDNTTEFTYKNKTFSKYVTPEILDEVCKFQFLPTDIVILTFPRSGTTFTQEIIWQIKNRKRVEKDEKVEDIMKRFPFLESDHKRMQGPTMTAFEMLESQRNDPYRLIKTHVPYELIKENIEVVNPKIIVVMRNAKDCFVSNFHFFSNLPFYAFKGTFDEFFELFVNERSIIGAYFNDNLEWWALRKQPNVLTLFYEDLLKDLRGNVEKISKFLGDELTAAEVDKILHNCSFSTMYNNPNINKKLSNNFTFLRKGIAGDWKEYLSKEQNETLDEKLESRFGRFGLKFIYE